MAPFCKIFYQTTVVTNPIVKPKKV